MTVVSYHHAYHPEVVSERVPTVSFAVKPGAAALDYRCFQTCDVKACKLVCSPGGKPSSQLDLILSKKSDGKVLRLSERLKIDRMVVDTPGK